MFVIHVVVYVASDKSENETHLDACYFIKSGSQFYMYIS